MTDFPYYGNKLDYFEPQSVTTLPDTQPQENKVDTTQELPAVSRLREAFEAAKNAIVEGTELAKQVEALTSTVKSLQQEVASFQRDVEYLRNRNRELDEQVMEVRRQRDEAVASANSQQDRAVRAEGDHAIALRKIEQLEGSLSTAYNHLDETKKQRDDAEFRGMDLEEKLKEAQAKLDKFQALMGEVFKPAPTPTPTEAMPTAEPAKPAFHWQDQPRDEVGKFQPIYPQGSQGGGDGSL